MTSFFVETGLPNFLFWLALNCDHPDFHFLSSGISGMSHHASPPKYQ
jgi:hypothetical protein